MTDIISNFQTGQRLITEISWGNYKRPGGMNSQNRPGLPMKENCRSTPETRRGDHMHDQMTSFNDLF